jgi:hypothetical protein
MARWLTGWRRVWVAWVVASVPIALAASARVPRPSELEQILDAQREARSAASARAFERITGISVSKPVTDAPSPAESGLLPMAVEANVQRYLEILAAPDVPLREELARIEGEFKPRLDRARIVDGMLSWGVAAAAWIALCLSAYAAGSAVAWMKRTRRRVVPS